MDRFLIKRKANEQDSTGDSAAGGSAGTSGEQPGPSSSSGPAKKKVQKTSKTQNPKGKSAYETKRKRDFVPSWKGEFPWLVNDEDESVMYCKWCREYPALADRTSPLFIGTGPGAKKSVDYRKGGLTTHDNSVPHKKVAGKKYADENPGEAPMDKHLKNLAKDEQNRVRMLMNTAHFTAKEDLAMKKYPKLCDLQEQNGLELGENYRTDKYCRQFVDVIAETTRETISSEIENSKFFCLMADGTTDRGVIEQEAVYVRYVDQDGEVKTKMADCTALESGNSDGVLKGIKEGLKSVGVDENVMKEKLISSNFDGAAVNMGRENGVAKKIRDEVGDHVITIHCVAHNLELAILDVMKDNDAKYMETLEATLRGIYKFYHLSPKKRRGLDNLAEVLDEDKPYYSGVKQVRWLASRYRAVTAVESHLRITVEHLENTAAAGDSVAIGLLNKLKDEKLIHFMYFMMDFMELMSSLSKCLQAASLLVTDVSHEVSEIIMKLCALKAKPGPNENTFVKNFNVDEKTLKHGNGVITLKPPRSRPARGQDNAEPEGHELEDETFAGENVISNARSSIINRAIEYIEDRFNAFDAPPLSHFKVFDCREWPTSRDELSVYGDDDITALIDHYKEVLTDDEKENIASEFCGLKSRLKDRRMRTSSDVLSAYTGLIRLAPLNLKHIITLIKIMMTLSVSTAEVERGFSALNRIKTPQRATMSQPCLQNHLMVSMNTAEVGKYDAGTHEINHWLSSGKGPKHVHGHKLPTPNAAAARKENTQ